MPKQSAVVPEEMMVLSYLPPCGETGGGGGIHNKLLYSQLEAGGSRVNLWVDSMKSSSPTHRKVVAPVRSTVTHIDDACGAWMKQHPSALASFEEIMESSKGKKIAMFLDYDGTLSPIVQDPDRAFMSDSMRAAVKDVARFFPTAIVSGRCREKVYNFVKLGELFYAGSHGMDIKGPSKVVNKHTTTQDKTVCFQPASDYLSMIDEVYNVLLEKMKSILGSNVENNKFCLSVHFRCVDEKRWSSLANQVISVIKEYPNLYLTEGKMVLEIRPTIEWDKGKALEFLLESLGFDDSNDVFPIYIGDDRTDEDAFKVLRERGQGLGILVSKTPKETSSSYSLQEPAEVMDFLLRLVGWKRASLKGLSKGVIRKKSSP